MNIEVGMAAPAFALFNTEKEKVSLGDYRGRNVLLLFFPQAFSRVCTQELCGIRDEIGIYDGLAATVIGISVDSVYTLAAYRQSQGYNFPLLSDFNKEVSSKYGAIYEKWNMEMIGVSKRAAFVIDKTGTVRYAEVLENAGNEPDYGKIKEILGGLN